MASVKEQPRKDNEQEAAQVRRPAMLLYRAQNHLH
jgi:hypothetical protein